MNEPICIRWYILFEWNIWNNACIDRVYLISLKCIDAPVQCSCKCNMHRHLMAGFWCVGINGSLHIINQFENHMWSTFTQQRHRTKSNKTHAHTHKHGYSVRTQITLMIVSCHRIIHMFIHRIQHHVWSFVHVVLCTIRTRIEWDPLCCRCYRWIRFVQLNIRGHCVLCAVSIVQPLHT